MNATSEQSPGGAHSPAGSLTGKNSSTVMDYLPRRSRRGRCQALNANGHRCGNRATVETTLHERPLDKLPCRWMLVRVCDDHQSLIDRLGIKQSDDRRRLMLQAMNHRKQFMAAFKNQHEKRVRAAATRSKEVN